MCYLMVYLIFDFATEATLKDAGLMGGALNTLTGSGFHAAEEGFESPAAVWNAALRHGQRSVWTALEHTNGYGLSVSVVTSNWRRLYVSADRGATEKPGGAQLLVQAGETLYNALHPDYGYGLVSLDVEPLEPPGTGDYGISKVYDYNFFSPRLVAKLGAERLDMLETARTVPLADGGQLLEISPEPLKDKKTYKARYEAAAKALIG